MKYRGIFEYEYPTEHKPPVGIDVHLHGDCVKGKIIEWEYKPLEQEPTTKNDLGVDCIDRAELLKAMDTWDKFGYDPNEGLIPLRTPVLRDRYVPYVKYGDMVNCVKGMPSVTPQEPRKGHWIKSRDSYGNNHFTCPFCEHDIATKADTWGDNYCSNCGADMQSNTKRKGEPIEGNNESYNCENWIP